MNHGFVSAVAYNHDNGVLLCTKIACKATYFQHGLVFRFSPIEEYEEQRISLFGVDTVQVSIVWFAIKNVVVD
jgi:hypothetical protein